jgi:cytochrome c peroxidase
LGKFLLLKKELLKKILDDPKYGKELERVFSEFLKGKRKVKDLRKIIEEYSKEHNLK